MNVRTATPHNQASQIRIPARLLWKFGVTFVIIAALLYSPVATNFNLTQTGQAAIPANVSLTCQPYVQVNNHAFDLGTGGNSDYASEEGFEVLVFNRQLYVGMEADNSLGARLWRTKAGVAIPASQADWEEVAADANGYPFGISEITQNDHIDSLAEFNGYLFASTANGGSSTYGTLVFRSPSGDPGSWENAIAAYGAGFGSVENTNFKDMIEFQGHLCGGTQNWSTGAQVWCTPDGITWEQKNTSGFGHSSQDIYNVEVWSSYVYNGALYFGVQNQGQLRSNPADDAAKIFRTQDISGTPTWTEVYSGPSGSTRADILGELDGYLYVATRGANGIVILRSPTGNSGSWEQVNLEGMDGDANNTGTVVDGAATHNGALYVAVSNTAQGFELWRTTGRLQAGSSLVNWEQVGGNGLTDTHNVHAQLIPYNGYFYVWTSNYTSGQQVLQTECGYEQTLPVSQTNFDYVFDPLINAAIRFGALGTVTQVTVKAYPGAWDSDGVVVNGVVPVKRHYTVSVNGAGYSADVVLGYDQQEFDESNIVSESTTYQALWTGDSWGGLQQCDRLI